MDSYLTLDGPIAHEIVINKSRFIGLTYGVEREEDIALCLDDSKDRYPRASHYCYGAVIGLGGLLQRFSDDGEPGGTAGMPILQVLLQRELKNVLIIVVRYFGGVKLGAGGLVRAYTRSAVEAADKAGVVRMTLSSRSIITLAYSLLGSLEYFLRQNNILIRDMVYGEKVSIEIVTKMPWEEFTQKVMDVASGDVKIERLDNEYYKWKDEV
ncbi:MAG TPA: YigZ family protein [Bacillota bacterium]|nr:YigZ family protein [Bacillota bacterium]